MKHDSQVDAEMKKTIFALTLISALFASLLVGEAFVEASPKTIIVSNDYPTIQEAIDNASEGFQVN